MAVLSHEDHIGVDCRRERFLQQFRGKSVKNRITVPNGGILPVSGATLSCQAVARAVRKTVALVQHHFVEKPENAVAAIQVGPIQRKRYLMGTFCTITAEASEEVVEKAFDRSSASKRSCRTMTRRASSRGSTGRARSRPGRSSSSS